MELEEVITQKREELRVLELLRAQDVRINDLVQRVTALETKEQPKIIEQPIGFVPKQETPEKLSSFDIIKMLVPEDKIGKMSAHENILYEDAIEKVFSTRARIPDMLVKIYGKKLETGTKPYIKMWLTINKLVKEDRIEVIDAHTKPKVYQRKNKIIDDTITIADIITPQEPITTNQTTKEEFNVWQYDESMVYKYSKILEALFELHKNATLKDIGFKLVAMKETNIRDEKWSYLKKDLLLLTKEYLVKEKRDGSYCITEKGVQELEKKGE